MKITDINSIESEIISQLRSRSAAGDNEAASILLDHLRKQAETIDKWRARKQSEERQNED